MSGTDEMLSEREEIELLLPWYVTGRLDADDTARVASYLARHPELRHQLEIIREEQGADVFVNEAIPAPALPSADELMVQISGGETGVQKLNSIVRRIRNSVLRFLEAPTPAAVRWAAAAAALVIVAQAAILGALLTRDEATYVAASGPGEEANGGAIALIAFADGASPGAIIELLEENHLRIVDGPLPGGFFRVRAENGTISEEERRQLLARLGSRRNVIKLVLPSQ